MRENFSQEMNFEMLDSRDNGTYMKENIIWTRTKNRVRRTAAAMTFRRTVRMRNDVSLISFCFDDFPRSALHTGGRILLQYGLRGTYYASFGLMGTNAPSGPIFTPDDIHTVIEKGHELGCHTFDHINAFNTSPRMYEESILNNRRALNIAIPGASFRTFAYPYVGSPGPMVKRRVARHFCCCRGGGQTLNSGTIDANLLKSYFLEHTHDDMTSVEGIIEENRKAKGWLIFVTHDISDIPTRYGCTPAFFERVVKASVTSGAKVLPVADAMEHTDMKMS
jgi:peptidoglycan/xylan/chitin deacetylase (PgdA/CDA1 family)